MIVNLLTKIFGSKNERDLKKMQVLVDQINAFEPAIKELSDNELKGKTVVFRERLEEGEELDKLLPEAFAVVREASWRVLEMRHFDCQLIGGITLHEGGIAEMKTGEGKTLVATLAAYLNALSGDGVHVITVNDYLAKRDSEWMGKLYEFLGLSVGVIIAGIKDDERIKAYSSDITYGTNNEFGFDYLRDNMKFQKEDIVQGKLNFCIVDEVDSILVDEARTPLIISGPSEQSTGLYEHVNLIIPNLKLEEHYTIDEKAKSVMLSDDGLAKAEQLLSVENLYDPKNVELLHHVNQALKAHTLFKSDVDYIVKDGEVVIVDEFTGRLMEGRRYSEGLHQALEAKEKVKIAKENQTLASITFQNYFRMYKKLSGMTGTAETEAVEFEKTYALGVMLIPTNQEMTRMDLPDSIYKTREEKFLAALDDIVERNKTGQPVLVGTISIDVSEQFSRRLKRKGIKHTVLNAKNHKLEAEIVANAGQRDAITISTNMAGRGTDIVLGEGVQELGGLHIIGTERHESRRIDNQLRGRAGRQGDAGSTRFYLSLEDDLMRIFGGEKIFNIMDRLGMEEGVPIEHKLISRAIENAQKKVEGHNFDIRKQLIEYDDVMNQQRDVIYKKRREALDGKNLKATIEEMILSRSGDISDIYEDSKTTPADWDHKGLADAVKKQFNLTLEFGEPELSKITSDGLGQYIYDLAIDRFREKEMLIGADEFRNIERYFTLQIVDHFWKDHLLNMDHLKEGIGLRSYAQQNPLLIYKKEGFEMFQGMIDRIEEEVLGVLFRIEISVEDAPSQLQKPKEQEMTLSHGGGGDDKKRPVKRMEDKVGRNDLCPCGSGKKHKKCCGS